ncbi:hypothetical protein TNCV_377691 [Trichonephila clavipes]|nr:hypothetical protein TNCV_377691 [Trichonephila clavipes]
MGYARETNCSPFTPTKLSYRTEDSSPRNLEPFEPTTHSSSHSNRSLKGLWTILQRSRSTDRSSGVGRNQATVIMICHRWMKEETTDRRGRSLYRRPRWQTDCAHGSGGSSSHITSYSITDLVCYASFGVSSYHSTLFAPDWNIHKAYIASFTLDWKSQEFARPMKSNFKARLRGYVVAVVVAFFPKGTNESCQSVRQIGLPHDKWRHHLSPSPQFRNGTGGKYSPVLCTRGFCCDRP